MRSIFDLIAADPNVSPTLRRLYTAPKDLLDTALEKAGPRRFLETPAQHSAFAGLDSDRLAEIRADERADHLCDEQRERDEAGL